MNYKNLRSVFVVITLFIMVFSNTGSAFAMAIYDFKDYDDRAWYYGYLEFMLDRDAVGGYSDGTFKPNNEITVAEFVKIAVAMLIGEQKKTETHWASGYMDAAFKAGVAGKSEFPEETWNAAITREQMAAIMERAAEAINGEPAIVAVADVDAKGSYIADFSEVSAQYKYYVINAKERGLIGGYSDLSLKPAQHATRAEAITMLARIANKPYRITNKEDKIVRSGASVSEFSKDPQFLALADDVLSHMVYKNGYAFLENGDRYGLTIVSQVKTSFAVRYTNKGKVYTLDANYNLIDVSIINSQNSVVTNVFDGKLSDTAYFVFFDSEKDTIYIVPNTLK